MPEGRSGVRSPDGRSAKEGTSSTNSGYTDGFSSGENGCDSDEPGGLDCCCCCCCCCCSLSPGPRLGEFDPGIDVGQAQLSLFRAHPAQMGLASLHFFLRRRQVKQPVLTRLMGSACLSRLMGGIREFSSCVIFGAMREQVTIYNTCSAGNSGLIHVPVHVKLL